MVPEGWEASTLGECVSIRSGGTPSKQKPEFWGGDVPWVSAKDLKTHLISDAQDHLTTIGAEYAKMAKPGSVLILVRGMTLLKDVPIGFVTKPVAFNQDLKALVANEDVDPKFLSYLLVAKKLQMMGLVNTANHGTGRLDTDLLKGLPVDVPPLPEQRKIAEILSTWDTALEKAEALLATAKAQKRALMQSLLTGKRRFPEFEGQPWKEVLLGDAVGISAGKSKRETLDQAGDKIVLDMGSVSREGTIIPKKRTFSGVDLLEPNDLVMPKDDIGGGNIIGKVILVLSNDQYVLGDHVYRLRVKPECPLRADFLRHVINGPIVNNSFRRKANGTAQLGLNRRDIEKQAFNMPPIDEQSKIAGILNATEVESERLKFQITKLRTEKKALMQQLLTGKRRPVV